MTILSNILSIVSIFCVVFEYFYFRTLLLPKQTLDFAENSRVLVCLFPLRWNSYSKKIGWSRAHKLVTSDVIL